LPAIRSVSGDFFTFQQDSAPAHRACEMVALLSVETPDFISPLDWPPNTPDLNTVDYAIWGILQDPVYRFGTQPFCPHRFGHFPSPIFTSALA